MPRHPQNPHDVTPPRTFPHDSPAGRIAETHRRNREAAQLAAVAGAAPRPAPPRVGPSIVEAIAEASVEDEAEMLREYGSLLRAEPTAENRDRLTELARSLGRNVDRMRLDAEAVAEAARLKSECEEAEENRMAELKQGEADNAEVQRIDAEIRALQAQRITVASRGALRAANASSSARKASRLAALRRVHGNMIP